MIVYIKRSFQNVQDLKTYDAWSLSHFHFLYFYGYSLKTGRQVVPGSIPGSACLPSHSEFSLVFFESQVNIC